MATNAIEIAREGKPPIIINPPQDPALKSLWELAELEVEANRGKAPATREDWNAVTDRYHALIAERRADLGSLVVREVQAPRPEGEMAPPKLTAILRDRLTAFGLALQAVVPAEGDGLRFSVLSAAASIEPMRAVLKRHRLEDKKRITYASGLRTVSWYEQPELMIQYWVSAESAIVLKEDDAGPVVLRFLVRTALDEVVTTYVIGDRPTPALDRAL